MAKQIVITLLSVMFIHCGPDPKVILSRTKRMALQKQRYESIYSKQFTLRRIVNKNSSRNVSSFFMLLPYASGKSESGILPTLYLSAELNPGEYYTISQSIENVVVEPVDDKIQPKMMFINGGLVDLEYDYGNGIIFDCLSMKWHSFLQNQRYCFVGIKIILNEKLYPLRFDPPVVQ